MKKFLKRSIYTKDLVFVTICIFFAMGLSACLPDKVRIDPPSKVAIIKGEIAGKKYFIPNPYFVVPSLAMDGGTIYIRAMYPYFSPAWEAPQTLLDKNEWYLHIDILAKYWPKLPPSNTLISKHIDILKAYEVVGEEYGLIHQTQPKGYNHDADDVWLELSDSEYISNITCSENLGAGSIPQCSHHMYIDGFAIKVNFDRRLLPEWKRIQTEFFQLFASFHSEESARTYYSQGFYLR